MMRWFLAALLVLSFGNLLWLHCQATERERIEKELYRLEFCLKVVAGEWPDYDAVAESICSDLNEKP